MAYYTRFTLTISNVPDQSMESLEQAIKAFGFEARDNGSYVCRAAWYSDKEDMRRISALYPEVLFTLHGRGEEATDLWYRYFKGGKMQYAPAKIIYDEFDENQLK